MHSTVLDIALVCQLALAALLTGYAAASRSLVQRLLLLDVLALVLVAALTLLGLRREQAAYLDLALVLALLGFAQTAAVARFLEQRGET